MFWGGVGTACPQGAKRGDEPSPPRFMFEMCCGMRLSMNRTTFPFERLSLTPALSPRRGGIVFRWFDMAYDDSDSWTQCMRENRKGALDKWRRVSKKPLCVLRHRSCLAELEERCDRANCHGGVVAAVAVADDRV